MSQLDHPSAYTKKTLYLTTNMENEKHPLDELKNDEITKIRKK